MSEQSPEAWDEAAASFDEAADHGLSDPQVRSAWADLLVLLLPSAPAQLADLGCGTGSLAILAADLGHDVVGVDFSEQMLARARSKAGGRTGISFSVGDVSAPPLVEATFDAVLCRHVLWALPDPEAALQVWVTLVRPRGRIVLIEGLWSTGAGLPSERVVTLLRRQGFEPAVRPLLDERYWGSSITDERYAVTAQKPGS
ncbi:class I SAM-dependent methyltransferase [Microlunatus lacustris]